MGETLKRNIDLKWKLFPSKGNITTIITTSAATSPSRKIIRVPIMKRAVAAATANATTTAASSATSAASATATTASTTGTATTTTTAATSSSSNNSKVQILQSGSAKAGMLIEKKAGKVITYCDLDCGPTYTQTDKRTYYISAEF